jgi:hypothetical protein
MVWDRIERLDHDRRDRDDALAAVLRNGRLVSVRRVGAAHRDVLTRDVVATKRKRLARSRADEAGPQL